MQSALFDAAYKARQAPAAARSAAHDAGRSLNARPGFALDIAANEMAADPRFKDITYW